MFEGHWQAYCTTIISVSGHKQNCYCKIKDKGHEQVLFEFVVWLFRHLHELFDKNIFEGQVQVDTIKVIIESGHTQMLFIKTYEGWQEQVLSEFVIWLLRHLQELFTKFMFDGHVQLNEA